MTSFHFTSFHFCNLRKSKYENIITFISDAFIDYITNEKY